MSTLPGKLTPIASDLEPIEVAARCRHLPGFVFLDSSASAGEAPQISLIAACPVRMLYGHDWESLRQDIAGRQVSGVFDDGLPRGAAIGAIDYAGSLCFGIYPELLIYDHAGHRWFDTGDLWSRLESGSEAAELPQSISFVPTLPRDQFLAMVQRAQEYIAAGDIYQVNLSQQFRAPWRGDAFAFYQALRHCSPAPLSAFLELGARTVLCSSPESFLKMSGRHVRTRPIKGTRPRRYDALGDERSAYDLLTSPKEIAELVMITDLERNDLGQVCEYGTVTVTELLKLERFEQVFHLVSTVTGVLREEIDQVTALEKCFPGGSITGAPKKRAREIISELEPVPRGLYTGAIGYFGFNGESHFNIAIRTVIVEKEIAHFHVGAGIVADSIPGKEYQETLDKAAGILLAAGSGRFQVSPIDCGSRRS